MADDYLNILLVFFAISAAIGSFLGGLFGLNKMSRDTKTNTTDITGMQAGMDAMRRDLDEERLQTNKHESLIKSLTDDLNKAQHSYRVLEAEHKGLAEKYNRVLEQLNEQGEEIKNLKKELAQERSARVTAEKQREEAQTHLAVVIAERNAFQMVAQRPIEVNIYHHDTPDDKPDPDDPPPGPGPGGKDKDNVTPLVDAVGKKKIDIPDSDVGKKLA